MYKLKIKTWLDALGDEIPRLDEVTRKWDYSIFWLFYNEIYN